MGGLNKLVTNDTVRHVVAPATMVQDKIIANNPDNPYASFFAPESKRAQQLELGADPVESAFDPGGFFHTATPSMKRQQEIADASADSAEAGWDRYEPTDADKARSQAWVQNVSGMAHGGTVTKARGLAALGRNGDDTLVHMSKQELYGLQNLAARHGTKLTTNPHTGLPEAFNLGKLLPTLAGVAVGIVAPEALPWIAAATAGAEKASGKSWGEAIGTGLQVYGGGSLTAGLTAAGEGATLAEVSPAADGVATGIAGGTGAAASGAADVAGAAAGTTSAIAPETALLNGMTPEAADIGVTSTGAVGDIAGTAGADTAAQSGITSQLPNGFGFDEGFNPASGAASPSAEVQSGIRSQLPASTTPDALPNPDTVGGRTDYALKGASTSKGWGEAWGDTNMAAKAGLGEAAIGAFSEEPKKPEEEEPVYYISDPKTGKPLYSPGTINPNIAKYGYLPAGEAAFSGQGFNPGVYSHSMDHYDPVKGMRSGGLAGIRRMADGGSATPQDRQITGQQILASNAPLPAAQEGTNQAALQAMNTGFANQATTGQYQQMAPTPPSADAMNDWMSKYNQMITPSGQSGEDATNQPVALGELSDAAKGDPNSPAYDRGFTPGDGFIGHMNQRIGEKLAMDNAPAQGATLGQAYLAARNDPSNPSYAPPHQNQWFTNEGVPFRKGEVTRTYGIYDEGTGKYYNAANGQVIPDTWKGSTTIGKASGGGIHALANTYAAGGKLLQGPGDGMSDSIPAVIGGQQPQRAALADGEFVVPADVVSHLGNGSTAAGSRKLYAMMAKIRKARTGRKSQAPEVNTDRFLPR